MAPRSPTSAPRNHSAVQVGAFQKIYDPSIGEHENWYINDHCFVCDFDGRWHLFGITHAEPAQPEQEKFFAHAIASDLLGPRQKLDPVMPTDEKWGETVVWATHVFEHHGLFWMQYCAGGKEH